MKAAAARALHPTEDERIARRSVVFAFIDLVGKLVGLLVIVLLARALPATSYGLVITGMAAALVVTMVVDAGVGPVLVRFLWATCGEQRAVATARYLLAGIAGVVGVLVLVSVSPTIIGATLVLGASYSLLSLPTLLADHRLARAALALVGPNTTLLILIWCGVAESAAAVLLLLAGCNACFAAASVAGFPRLYPTLVDCRALGRIYKEAFPAGLFAIATNAYGKLDTVLLSVLISPVLAGRYGTYYRFVLTLVGFTAWASKIASRSFRLGPGYFLALRRALLTLLTLGAVAAALFGLTASWLIGSLMHQSPLPVPTVVMLALLLLPSFLIPPATSALLVNGSNGSLASCSILVLCVACVLYPVLILWRGAFGAALASLALESLAAYLFVRRAATLGLGEGRL